MPQQRGWTGLSPDREGIVGLYPAMYPTVRTGIALHGRQQGHEKTARGRLWMIWP